MAAADDLAREMEAFNAEYRSGVPDRLREVDAHWAALTSANPDALRLRALLRALHSIAGSALTFGMPALGAAAALAEGWIEPYCERGEAPQSGARPQFEALLAALRRAATEP